MYQCQTFFSCFFYFSKDNLYRIFFMHHIQIFYPMILFFIFICDKYVSHFFYLSLKSASPLCFFIFINGKYLSCVFLCINDKYLSRVLLFVNENYLSCVFVPMMNICALFFLIFFKNKFLSCAFSFDIY